MFLILQISLHIYTGPAVPRRAVYNRLLLTLTIYQSGGAGKKSYVSRARTHSGDEDNRTAAARGSSRMPPRRYWFDIRHCQKGHCVPMRSTLVQGVGALYTKPRHKDRKRTWRPRQYRRVASSSVEGCSGCFYNIGASVWGLGGFENTVKTCQS